MLHLYEIFVPTKYGDTGNPISTKHHKNWDNYVRKITGGLTLMGVARGQWLHRGELFEERIIPVRVACEPNFINPIVTFTIEHYRQTAVMFFKVTEHVEIRYRVDKTLKND
jgi:hypothetical protein